MSALALEKKEENKRREGERESDSRRSKLEEYSVFERAVTKLANRSEYDYTRKETSWSGIEE